MTRAIDEKIETLKQQIGNGEEMLRRLRYQVGFLEGERRMIRTALWPVELMDEGPQDERTIC